MRRRLQPVPGARLEVDSRCADLGAASIKGDVPIVDLRWAPDPSGTSERLRSAASTRDFEELHSLGQQGITAAGAIAALVAGDEGTLTRLLHDRTEVPRHLPLDVEIALTAHLRLVWPFGREALGAAAAVLTAAAGLPDDALGVVGLMPASLPAALVHMVLLRNAGDSDSIAAQGYVDVFDDMTAVLTIIGAVALRDAYREREALIGLDAVLRHDGLGRSVLRLARLERARTRAAVGDLAGGRDDLERLLSCSGRDIAAREAFASLRTPDASTFVTAAPPEELELQAKEGALRSLQSELVEAEITLATLETELHTFSARHHDVLAARYMRLDQLSAREAELRAGQGDVQARLAAEAARRRVISTESAVECDRDRNRDVLPPTNEIKQLYRDVARRLHPDLASDDEDRVVRQRLMSDANVAYALGDRETLLRVAGEYADRVQSVTNDDVGSRLVRAIRSLAGVRTQLASVVEAYDTLLASPLAHLQRQVDDAADQGHDLLAEMAVQIDAEIDAARARVAELCGEAVERA